MTTDKPKSTYIVTIPLAGAVHIEVEAASEKEAIASAWETTDDANFDPSMHDMEWEYFEQLTEGNVLHPQHNEVEATLVPEMGKAGR